MNIIIPSETFNINNIYFQDPIKNNIFDNSNFIKIIYSNNVLTLNCVVIEFNLYLMECDVFYNKHKYSYNVNLNFNTIITLYAIEKNILSKLSHLNKRPVYRLYEILSLGYIKVFHEKNDMNGNKTKNNNDEKTIMLDILHSFGVKISGVWENNVEYGLTYKFIKL